MYSEGVCPVWYAAAGVGEKRSGSYGENDIQEPPVEETPPWLCRV